MNEIGDGRKVSVDINDWTPRIIRQDYLGPIMISTIELPYALYLYGDRFETMAFGQDHFNDQLGPIRFHTEEEALFFHEECVRRITDRIAKGKERLLLFEPEAG